MMNSEDARSDFVLAAAGAVLMPFLASLVANLPGYPSPTSLLGELLAIAWMGATLAFVPVVIVRYREQGPKGFALGGSRAVLSKAAVLAVPLLVLGYLRAMALVGPVRAALGRLAIPFAGSPTLGDSGLDPLDVLVRALYLVVLVAGSLVLVGFLIDRARDAFRSVDLPVVEALRTYGMAAAAAGLLFGLLAMVGRGVGASLAIGAPLVVVALVLLADRHVYAGMTTSRAAVLAPAIATAVFHVLATGGVFGGDLVLGLWWGSLGFGLVVVAACLARTGPTALAWTVPVVAAVLWPTCISPVSVVQGAAGFCL